MLKVLYSIHICSKQIHSIIYLYIFNQSINPFNTDPPTHSSSTLVTSIGSLSIDSCQRNVAQIDYNKTHLIQHQWLTLYDQIWNQWVDLPHGNGAIQLVNGGGD